MAFGSKAGIVIARVSPKRRLRLRDDGWAAQTALTYIESRALRGKTGVDFPDRELVPQPRLAIVAMR